MKPLQSVPKFHPLLGDLSRLGSGERNLRSKGPRGPSERERVSHWAGVRASVHPTVPFRLYPAPSSITSGEKSFSSSVAELFSRDAAWHSAQNENRCYLGPRHRFGGNDRQTPQGRRERLPPQHVPRAP